MYNGYLSEEAKKKFSIRAGILGVVFFMLQFIIPFLFIIPVFIFGAFKMMEMNNYDFSKAVTFE